MDLFLAICVGVTLSAACGFRIFIPPFIMSLAANYGNFPIPRDFAWVGTEMGLMVLAIATIVEVGAYYIPVVDNLLDTIEIPTAIAIGTTIMGATLGMSEIDPILQWLLAAVVGGGAAGTMEGVTVMTRAASTGFTGGLGNPFLSTTEALSAAVLSVLALTAPLLAWVLAIAIVFWAAHKILHFLGKRRKS
jgi:hypothetical protein